MAVVDQEALSHDMNENVVAEISKLNRLVNQLSESTSKSFNVSRGYVSQPLTVGALQPV
jgi:hypothetical protein